MPTVTQSGASYAIFNGGTITQPLIIQSPVGGNSIPLLIEGSYAAQNVDFFQVLNTDAGGAAMVTVDAGGVLQANDHRSGHSGIAYLSGNDGGSLQLDDDSGNTINLIGGGIGSTPQASATANLILGTAYHNPFGYDVMLTVYLSVTANTSGVVQLGVGPTNTPTQQTIITGLTATGVWPIPIYLPTAYYALLSISGTITSVIDGQIAIPV